MVPRFQICQLAFDSEELADKILDVRRQVHDQLRTLLRIQRRRIPTRRFKSIRQPGIRGPQFIPESLIQFRQAVSLVEILEAQSKPGDEGISGMYVSLIFHGGFLTRKPLKLLAPW